MTIQGLRTTENFVADARPKNWRQGILMQYPNGSAPLFALTSLMKSRQVDDPEFNWWEKSMQTRRFTLTANLTIGGTSISVVGNARALKIGDLLWVEETDEILRVVATPTSDTTITVERGFADSTAATLDFDGVDINPNLTVVGSVQEEGSMPPPGVSFDPTKKFNYTEIFRNTFEATRTATRTRLRTKDAVKEAKRECLEIHSADIERALWLGLRWEGVLNQKPARTMGGVYRYIAAENIIDAGATTDMETLEGWLEQLFRFGSDEKMCFTGNRGLLIINQIVRKNSHFNIVSGIREYGMRVSRLTTPYGEVVLKSHPLFNQMANGINAGTNSFNAMNSWLWFLDQTDLTYVNLKGDDTKYEPKLEANGLDGLQSGYLTEASIEVHHPLNHMVVRNLQAAAEDA